MRYEDLQTGDSLIVSGEAFLSKAIEHEMRKWGKQQGYNDLLVFSHGAGIIDQHGKKYVYGSIDSGYRAWEFEKHYDWDKTRFIVMRRRKPLTQEEKDLTAQYMIHLTTVSSMYQYWNFIQWELLIRAGIDTFNEGASKDNITYCYEAEFKRRGKLNPEYYTPHDYKHPDVFQLVYDPNYQIIHISPNVTKVH